MPRIYVYGTLRRGESLHYLLGDAKYYGTKRIPGFILVQPVDSPIPYAVPASSNSAWIEVEDYAVDYVTFRELDKLEGGYTRIMVDGHYMWVWLKPITRPYIWGHRYRNGRVRP